MILLDHQAQEDRDLVVLSGRLVSSVCAGVADDLIAIFDDGCGVLHLEMSEVQYIDSKGLAALVSVMRRIHKDEGLMALVNISDEVLTLLELTRLDEVFKIIKDDLQGQQDAA